MVEKVRIKPSNDFDVVYTFCGNQFRIKGTNQSEREANLVGLLKKLKEDGRLVERDDIFYGKPISQKCKECGRQA